MALSGGMAGMMALNEILGVQHKLLLNFTSGYGFTGIAVALMGRNHPAGIVLASLLFGALFQGGAGDDTVVVIADDAIGGGNVAKTIMGILEE